MAWVRMPRLWVLLRMQMKRIVAANVVGQTAVQANAIHNSHTEFSKACANILEAELLRTLDGIISNHVLYQCPVTYGLFEVLSTARILIAIIFKKKFVKEPAKDFFDLDAPAVKTMACTNRGDGPGGTCHLGRMLKHLGHNTFV